MFGTLVTSVSGGLGVALSHIVLSLWIKRTVHRKKYSNPRCQVSRQSQRFLSRDQKEEVFHGKSAGGVVPRWFICCF